MRAPVRSPRVKATKWVIRLKCPPNVDVVFMSLA